MPHLTRFLLLLIFFFFFSLLFPSSIAITRLLARSRTRYYRNPVRWERMRKNNRRRRRPTASCTQQTPRICFLLLVLLCGKALWCAFWWTSNGLSFCSLVCSFFRRASISASCSSIVTSVTFSRQSAIENGPSTVSVNFASKGTQCHEGHEGFFHTTGPPRRFA